LTASRLGEAFDCPLLPWFAVLIAADVGGRRCTHVTNRWNHFAPVIGKTIEEAGGKFLARGGRTIAMHGKPPAPRVVVVQFDSLDKAQAWANSPAAKAAFTIGAKYSTLNDYIVEGVSQ
jgi:uncharacterized protein (DUF1330 family)